MRQNYLFLGQKHLCPGNVAAKPTYSLYVIASRDFFESQQVIDKKYDG